MAHGALNRAAVKAMEIELRLLLTGKIMYGLSLSGDRNERREERR